MSTVANVRTSGYVNTGLVALFVMDCPTCGVIFGINTDYEQRRRDDGQRFFCPNGHSQSWHDTEAKRLKAKLEREEQDNRWYAQQLASRDEDLRAVKVAHAATKGQLTKTRKRADRGVCQHCQRSFVNVQRHVAHMHPEAVSS